MNSPNIPLVFNVYKPSGMTSFEVVRQFKKNLNFDFGKIGHFGTLDPFAEGVLLIGILGAQKINDYVHEFLPKTYRAKGVFGQKTLSGDHTTEICEEKFIDSKWLAYSNTEIEKIFKEKFLGEYWQSPHSFSAVKYNGKRLYELARHGVKIQKEKVKREIYALKIISFNSDLIEFEITVSSGTYIRSFFEELSEFLGGRGHLIELIRTSIGHLSIENSLLQENWPIKGEKVIDLSKSVKIDQVLPFHQIILSGFLAKLFQNGVRLRRDQILEIQWLEFVPSQNYFWVYDDTGRLLGLSEFKENHLYINFIVAQSE